MKSEKLVNWQKFVKEDVLMDSVNPIIGAAWQRCKRMNVDPEDGLGKPVDRRAYEQALIDNKELLEIARPIMANLHEIVLGTHFVLVLTDKDSRIIETIGDTVVIGEAEKLRYQLGAVWNEENVGANAIGTCLVADVPIQFAGPEHYCKTHHKWTCSATPIHDDKGRVIGCLDMSGDMSMANSHTLGIVVAAAFSIEREMALKKSHQLLSASFESTSDGMILTDRDHKIIKINNRATDILGVDKAQLLHSDVKKLFDDVTFDYDLEYLKHKGNIHLTDSTALIQNRRIDCTINMVPIIIDSSFKGFGIAFREAKYLHRAVNKVAGNVAIYGFEDIVGNSIQMNRVIDSAKKIAKTRSSVLIEGESGTGKELFAQAIHKYSTRKKGPFVAINCASLPRELIESELFGYEKGAFTGALKEGKAGKFELAEGGTIFLDEIGEMPIEVQAKLLRVLDNYSISRIGGRYEKKLDVRIIAATNRNLMEEAENKNFRYDLYYRLNVFKLELPPLRERKGDIVACAEYFLKNLNHQNNNGVKVYDQSFVEALRQYRWVGNVRELQNIVERAYYLCDESVITTSYLPKHFGYADLREVSLEKETVTQTPILDVHAVERRNIINMLIETDKNVLEAAKKLSMSKSTIYRKLQKYHIDVSEL